MRFDGHLKSWNDDRGFGFIEPAQGGQEIFVHIKAFPRGTGRPSVGQALSFEVELGANGKKRARAVQYPARGRAPRARHVESPARWSLPRVLAIPAFLGVCFYISSKWRVEPVVPLLYVVVSIVAFFAYAVDKSAAVNGRWRTPESTLHILGLAGGWPGALLAQQVLRHKSSKPSFVIGFWLTVAANVAAFVGWHASVLGKL